MRHLGVELVFRNLEAAHVLRLTDLDLQMLDSVDQRLGALGVGLAG